MTAIDWGWSVEETAQRLMQESTKAQENGEKYPLPTARLPFAFQEPTRPRQCDRNGYRSELGLY